LLQKNIAAYSAPWRLMKRNILTATVKVTDLMVLFPMELPIPKNCDIISLKNENRALTEMQEDCFCVKS